MDSLRRAPQSFADLKYYSQVPYKLIPKSDKPRLARFRLVPDGLCEESGLLEYSEQHTPWEFQRNTSETRGEWSLYSVHIALITTNTQLHNSQTGGQWSL